MLNNWWIWGTGLLGLGGIASLWLIPGLAPLLTVLITASGPLLKGFTELLVWFVKTVWEGLMDILDNLATIITVLALVAGFSVYYKYWGPERQACEQEIVLMKKQIDGLKAKLRGR